MIPVPREALDDWLAPRELADWLKIPVRTVYDWRTRGFGPTGYKVGKHVRYRRSDVEAWVITGGGAETTSPSAPLLARKRAPRRAR